MNHLAMAQSPQRKEIKNLNNLCDGALAWALILIIWHGAKHAKKVFYKEFLGVLGDLARDFR